MRVGIYLDLRNPPQWQRPWAEHYTRWLDACATADRLGVSSVWLSEHHLFEDGYLTQPLTFAAAVAARTTRIRIGTAILIAPLRPALQIAEEASVVDLVSGGRLDLGVGAGYRRPEYDAFGADYERRGRIARERLTELDRLFGGDLTPPTVQQPFPLWSGLAGPAGARLTGRLGLGLLSTRPEALGPYREGLEESGHPASAASMAGAAPFVLADDPEEAWRSIAPHFAYMWSSYRRYGAEGGSAAAFEPFDPAAWLGPGRRGAEVPGPAGPISFRVLTVDEAEAFLRRQLEDVPLEEVFCWASIAGMPDDIADRQLELVAQLVARMGLVGEAEAAPPVAPIRRRKTMNS